MKYETVKYETVQAFKYFTSDSLDALYNCTQQIKYKSPKFKLSVYRTLARGWHDFLPPGCVPPSPPQTQNSFVQKVD